MHYLIRILGKAESRDAAYVQALAFAEHLVDRDEFDYYDADSLRFEHTGYSAQLVTEVGRLAVAEALTYNRTAFDRALADIRRILAEFSDEQIYQNEYGDEPRDFHPSRYPFAVLGGDTHDCFLYGDDSLWGGKIENDTDYALATGDCEPSTLWVTSLDFHS